MAQVENANLATIFERKNRKKYNTAKEKNKKKK